MPDACVTFIRHNLSINHFTSQMRSAVKSLLSSKPKTLNQRLASFSRFSHPVPSQTNHTSSINPQRSPVETLNFMKNSTFQVPSSLYNPTLASLSSDEPIFDHARILFDLMLQRKIQFDDLGFGCFIKRTCNYEFSDTIITLIEKVQNLTHLINGSVMACLIVDALCRNEKIEDAWNALERLRSIGWKPDFIAYRNVSEGFRVANRIDETRMILKEKRKLGVAPRITDYEKFVLWLIHERKIIEAMHLGEAIIYGDFAIDDVVIDVLIGSVSDIDCKNAILLLEHMIKRNWFPNIALIRHIGLNLCKNENGSMMHGLFDMLMNTGKISALEQYNMMISLLCKAKKLREAYDVLKDMTKKGFSPDVGSYNCLMEACCENDLVRPAKKLWDEMFANGRCPNLRTYNILIGKLLEEGEVEEGRSLLQHMKGKEVIPDETTYRMLIRALCGEKNVEGAVEVFKEAMKQDGVVGKSILGDLILALCKLGKYTEASDVFHNLPSNTEDSSSHVILLKSLTVSGAFGMAIGHIKWVKERSPCKFERILKDLIANFSTAPKLEPVVELLRLLHADKLVSSDDPLLKLLEVTE